MGRYIQSTITRQTSATSKAGFGTVLILGLTKVAAYKEYIAATAVAEITTDFGAGAKEVLLATAIMAQNPRLNKVVTLGILFTEGTSPTTDLSNALNTLMLTKNDFYFVTCTGQADATVTALSAWAATQNKLYFASTVNKTLGTTLNSPNTVLLVHNTPNTYPAEAWVGVTAPMDVGTFTFTFKQLNGILASNYTTTEVNTIHTANGNTYIQEGGVNITSNGKATSGEYADIIQSQHYLDARIAENIFGLLVRMPKVPFDYNGVALTVAEVEKAIKAAPSGMIARDAAGKLLYMVTAPDVTTISTNDKALRSLPNVSWTVTLAGAIENVTLQGVLQV